MSDVKPYGMNDANKCKACGGKGSTVGDAESEGGFPIRCERCNGDGIEPEHCAFCPERETSITCHASDGRPCCYDCAKKCSGCGVDCDSPMAPSDEYCVDCAGLDSSENYS